MSRKRHQNLPVDVSEQCPFCPGTFAVSLEANAIAHTLPTCPEFEKSAALDYLTRARRAIERKRLS